MRGADIESALTALDSSFEKEIKRVSTVEYNSQEICTHFFNHLRARYVEELRASPPSCYEEMLLLLNDINNWLVCYAIATPEDMAQSFQHFQEEVDALLEKIAGGAA